MKDKPKAKAQEDKDIIITKRDLAGPISFAAMVIAIIGALYHLYVAGFGSTSAMILRSFHWTFISALAFLLYPANKKSPRNKPTLLDIFLAVVSLIVGLYVVFNWQTVAENGGFTTSRDTFMGVIEIVLVLEASRRVVGLPLAILAGVFLAYGFAGPYMPSILAHKGYDLEAVTRTLYMSTDGIFGMPIGISASYVVLFVLFGAFLQASGGGKFFTDLAFGLVGRAVGGPAKAAVVSSSLMGTMSGAAVANVVTTGTFTIPLMKRTGYPPYVAGAIEAVASTGGQFVPPVMGAAAFMIAEIVGVPYGKVALAAIIPSLLYYVYLYQCVHLEAKKAGLSGLSKDQIPSIKEAILEGGHLAIPLAVLIVLIIKGYSPGKVVFWSIVLLVVVSMLRKSTRMNVKDMLNAMENGIQNAIPVASACAAAGIITGIISLTGVGLRFSSILISLSGNSVFLMLVLTMVASIILGMGLPTSAAYVILAVLTAPALIKLGVDPLAAHFFIFFFGCISTITPPVALSAYAGAGIAGADPMKTGFTAFRLGLVGYLVPFIGVFHPAILMKGEPWQVLLFTLQGLVAIISLTYGIEGFINRRLNSVERLLFVVAAALILVRIDLVLLNSVGIAIFIILLYRNRAVQNLSALASGHTDLGKNG
ncbi:TRAP C4-dicarboxylate transport system permease DctM subunit [Moorella glycerini]|uniref:Sialic acid TRAP transporter permease protein SiaT n=1 Tax=Neomoorella stamsii TaxID=1266720 RepID=A0A9X7P531_9FIRM|nr:MULTISPECIES: TRAP transporter permease [Moorella]PRR70046.1 Sialic acid TRAP transporter permease protein SiaT [Moorella stamsii]CEP68403.1 TRAP C4-dicarboxylate transport system permease DctM subunit [Moorella glycerini]